jgi:hypothetical protein
MWHVFAILVSVTSEQMQAVTTSVVDLTYPLMKICIRAAVPGVASTSSPSGTSRSESMLRSNFVTYHAIPA